MSSFRKRNVYRPILGTRTSARTGQIIISSGNPSLDQLLGGGLAVGSICLIEEDKFVTHSKVLAKYFLAEGVLAQHGIFLGSLDDDPKELLEKLPKPLNEEEMQEEMQAQKLDDAVAAEFEGQQQQQQNGLRIAWRYNDLPPIVHSAQATAKIGHHYNLLEFMDTKLLEHTYKKLWNDITMPTDAEQEARMKKLEMEELDELLAENKQAEAAEQSGHNNSDESDEIEVIATAIDVSAMDTSNSDESMNLTPIQTEDALNTTSLCNNASTSNSGFKTASPRKLFKNLRFEYLLHAIYDQLNDQQFENNNQKLAHKNVLRICLTSLGSPLWYDDNFELDIMKFLTLLRGMMRHSNCVVFITMPMHLVKRFDETLVPRIRVLADYAFELESFAGAEDQTNPAFRDYNGLFHLRKITALNALSTYKPETTDLAYKLRRKKFVIEKLHLPPELQDENVDKQKLTFSCSAATTATAGSGGAADTEKSDTNYILNF